MRQESFFKPKDFPKEFGGERLKGKRKNRRPLSTKRALHLVLRAKTTGFLQLRRELQDLIFYYAKLYEIKVYGLGLESHHIHFVIKFKSIDDYKGFIRALGGTIAKKFKITWLYRPFSRVVEWGRAFRQACKYVFQNELEGLGIIPHQPRNHYRGLG